jgi:hypothetical protein
MKVYIVVGMESSSFDWDIIKTVFTNRDEAIEVCRSLNNSISGYEYSIQEMELK